MSKKFLKFGLGALAAVCLLPTASRAVDYPPLPSMTIPGGLSGEAAVAALGNKLPAVAAHYGRTTNALVSLFAEDSSARLDSRGNIYHICDNSPVLSGASITNHQSPKQLFPLNQTFLLHSKPGSAKTVYLDFDGYTISGTAWNDDFNGGADIIAPPWDIDGNPGAFSANERTIIQQVWLRVAEDYAPFDVDVTTEFPGDAAITRSSLADQVFGTRVLISPIASQIVFAGGVAYLGAFNQVGDYLKPALVFPENLGNDEKNIAEAASHECGHNLNLLHQGTSAQAYFLGHGNWAPIMGAGYYVSVSHWARGEYQDANNQEDELSIITSTGLSYRSQDFGTNLPTATPFYGVNNVTNGVISRTNETDFFSFQTGGGTATVSVSPWERGANLHLFVAVYDANGNSVTNGETADSVVTGTAPVVLSFPVINGKYYVSVGGKGYLDPLTTGYSYYGSLGQYTLSITNPFGSGTVISAPPQPWGNNLSVMNGSNPNGSWLLFVQDDKALDSGAISNGWSVAITSANPVGFAADNEVVATPSYSLLNLGSTWNVAVTITNYGPSIATNVLVTDALPVGAGVSLASSVPSSGGVSLLGSSLLWNLGNLSPGSGAVLNLSFNTLALGSYTNTLIVSSTTADTNPDNNTSTAVANVAVLTPPAFASITFSGGVPTFNVTNAAGATPAIIEASTNLIGWLPIHTNTTPFSFTDNDATNYLYRFYRTLLAP
jgi:uncharacterized repeat protein (TIGR01451 family)